MKKKILIFLTINLLLSCNLSNDFKKINSEISKISSLYQTEVTYKITKKLKSDINQNILLIKVMLNDKLKDKYKEKYYIPASNIAFILFKNLPSQSFTNYVVEFYDKNNKVMTKKYERKNLDRLIKKISVFNMFNSLLKRKEYEQIYNMFDKKFLNLSKEKFIRMFNQFDTITDIKYEGFLYGNLLVKVNSNKIPYIASFESISIGNEELPIYIIMNVSNNKLVSIQSNWE